MDVCDSLSYMFGSNSVALEQYHYYCSGSEIIQGDKGKIKWYKKHNNQNVVWTVCRFGLYIHDGTPFQLQTKLEWAASNGNRYPPYPQVMATAISQ